MRAKCGSFCEFTYRTVMVRHYQNNLTRLSGVIFGVNKLNEYNLVNRISLPRTKRERERERDSENWEQG